MYPRYTLFLPHTDNAVFPKKAGKIL